MEDVGSLVRRKYAGRAVATAGCCGRVRPSRAISPRATCTKVARSSAARSRYSAMRRAIWSDGRSTSDSILRIVIAAQPTCCARSAWVMSRALRRCLSQDPNERSLGIGTLLDTSTSQRRPPVSIYRFCIAKLYRKTASLSGWGVL
jgi:hypothetical protein